MAKKKLPSLAESARLYLRETFRPRVRHDAIEHHPGLASGLAALGKGLLLLLALGLLAYWGMTAGE